MSSIIPTSVYAELTPNPASIKFVADRQLLQPGLVAEYLSREQARGSSELAEKLFEFPFVGGVFISGNFITVTNNGAVSWDYVNFEVREFIREYLLHNMAVVTKMPAMEEKKKERAAMAESDAPPSPFDEQIIQLLDEYVRPAVEGDGGAIDYKSFKDGVVTVSLRGSCSGCPSSSQTLKGGIENLLKANIPEVKLVVAEEL